MQCFKCGRETQPHDTVRVTAVLPQTEGFSEFLLCEQCWSVFRTVGQPSPEQQQNAVPACMHCGWTVGHMGCCPVISSIDYNPDGTVRSIAYRSDITRGIVMRPIQLVPMPGR